MAAFPLQSPEFISTGFFLSSGDSASQGTFLPVGVMDVNAEDDGNDGMMDADHGSLTAPSQSFSSAQSFASSQAAAAAAPGISSPQVSPYVVSPALARDSPSPQSTSAFPSLFASPSNPSPPSARGIPYFGTSPNPQSAGFTGPLRQDVVTSGGNSQNAPEHDQPSVKNRILDNRKFESLPGPPRPSGLSGPPRPSGPSGPSGSSGLSGPPGRSGPSGPSGLSGPSGPSGPSAPRSDRPPRPSVPPGAKPHAKTVFVLPPYDVDDYYYCETCGVSMYSYDSKHNGHDVKWNCPFCTEELKKNYRTGHLRKRHIYSKDPKDNYPDFIRDPKGRGPKDNSEDENSEDEGMENS